MVKRYLFIAMALLCISAQACEKKTPDGDSSGKSEQGSGDSKWDGNNVEDEQTLVKTAVPDDGLHIYWDSSTERKIAQSGGYARVIRLSDGSYLAVYEDHRGNVVASHCEDGTGVQWTDVRTAIAGYNWSGTAGTVWMGAANAEAYQLSDGTVLAACNYRPSKEGIGPYSIAVARSDDGGYTWSPAKVIFEASSRSTEGCWEPAFLELPDGTVQVYFANEAPYSKSSEQEISMLESKDGGLTWSQDKKQVCFRAKHRDGMPVPCLIDDEIVVAIEDNGRGQLQPFTVRTSVANSWSVPVTGDSPARDFCLPESVSGKIYMGAPYLAVMQDGTTVLSYQSVEGRQSNWELSCMEVALGDRTARDFGNVSRPFDVPQNLKGKWNSVMAWDDHTLLAVSSTNKDGMAVAPWIKKGYLFADVTASAGTQSEDHFFVETSGSNHLFSGIGTDGGKLVFRTDVKDLNLPIGKTSSHAVVYFINASGKDPAAPCAGVYKLMVSCDAQIVRLWEGNNGEWTVINLRGVDAISKVLSDGYSLSVVFDPETFTNYAASDSIRVGMYLITAVNASSSQGRMMEYSDESCPASWRLVHLE